VVNDHAVKVSSVWCVEVSERLVVYATAGERAFQSVYMREEGVT